MLGDYQEEIEIRPKWIIIDDALALVALLDLVGPQSDCVSHIHQPRPPRSNFFVGCIKKRDYCATSAHSSKLRMFHIRLVALRRTNQIMSVTFIGLRPWPRPPSQELFLGFPQNLAKSSPMLTSKILCDIFAIFACF